MSLSKISCINLADVRTVNTRFGEPRVSSRLTEGFLHNGNKIETAEIEKNWAAGVIEENDIDVRYYSAHFSEIHSTIVRQRKSARVEHRVIICIRCKRIPCLAMRTNYGIDTVSLFRSSFRELLHLEKMSLKYLVERDRFGRARAFIPRYLCNMFLEHFHLCKTTFAMQNDRFFFFFFFRRNHYVIIISGT